MIAIYLLLHNYVNIIHKLKSLFEEYMKFIWLFSVVFVLTGCCGIRFPGVPCYDELTGKNGKKITDPKRVPQMNNSRPEALIEDSNDSRSYKSQNPPNAR